MKREKLLPPFAGDAPRELKEQATDLRLAALKARMYVRAGDAVADLTAGLGSDALAFYEAGARVTAVEAAPERADFLRSRLPADIEVVCARAEDFDRPCDLVYLDPARRDGAARILGYYSPDPFVLAPRLLRLAPRVVVKLSPLFSPQEVAKRFPSLRECRVLSLHGEVKETLAVLERGFSGTPEFRATGLRSTGVFDLSGGGEAPEGDQGQYLCRPDPAVYAAGALPRTIDVFFPSGACVTGPHGFVLSPSKPETEFPGETYRVLRRMPFNPKKIRAEIKALERVEIVPQAFGLKTPEIYQKLKIKPGGTTFLFLTRFRGRSLVFWAERES